LRNIGFMVRSNGGNEGRTGNPIRHL